MACCGAFFVTSSIHGKASSFRAFNSRRREASDGFGPHWYSFHSAYSCCQRANAQFQAKRAVPVARAK